MSDPADAEAPRNDAVPGPGAAEAVDARPWIEVAAAVIERPADGRFLLAQRPPGKVYAGWWEFPGGKVERGESAAQALARELAEELGVTVHTAYPWIERRHVYAHGRVRLRFFRVVDWSGTPEGREGQAFAWQRLPDLDVGPMLPANGPVLGALALPLRLRVTAPDVDAVRVAAALARDAADAAAAGLVGPGSLVVVRRPDLAPDALRAHVAQVRAVLAAAGPAHLLAVNADLATAAALGVEAVHLTATRLRALSARPDGFARVGASCHTADELAHAEALGLDWALLGHVHATPSHPEPEARALGWDGFARLAAERTLPVYAIGGLGFGDLDVARRCGAHGVGAIRAAWWPR